MSRVLNIGSLNIDYVYQVPHFLRGGETLAAYRRAVHIGGKGLNQSVALARAGLKVSHAGMVGSDGGFLKAFLANEGVDTLLVKVLENEPSGHTFIQVIPEAENAILYYPGTNVRLTRSFVKEVIEGFCQGDALLVQNETSAVRDAIELGLEKGMRVILNPSPFDRQAPLYPLNRLSALVLNETEAEGLLAMEKAEKTLEEQLAMVEELGRRYPDTVLLVTLGSRGVAVKQPGFAVEHLPAFRVHAVDTTGAGDTFTGYAVRALMRAWKLEEQGIAAERRHAVLMEGLKFAAMAAAMSVTKAGSAESIPTFDDVDTAILSL